MYRTMLKSKIHKATITETHVDYEGSIEIDEMLMEKADLLPGERVQVLNLDNGNRLETYVILGKKGSGVIGLRGPAALKGEIGEKVIILAYAICDDKGAHSLKPKIVYVDGKNKILKVG